MDGGSASTVTMPALIEVNGLAKCYGDQIAIRDISLSLDAGEIVGIIGPNGAGKTTLLETLTGLVAADAGDVRVHGQPVLVSARRRWMFYVPDGVRPYQEQFAYDVLTFFAAVYRRSRAEIRDIVEALGLRPVVSKRVQALSKGYARRLLLAIGLLSPHPVLLMDEPFDGLDLRQTREIAQLLRIEARQGRALLLCIHQLSDAERVCDRFVLLSEGRIRGAGSLDELRAKTGLPHAHLEDIFLALT